MKFTSRKHEGNNDKFSVFSFSISTYSIGTYDAFSDDFVFDTQIKSQWSAGQLVELGNYLESIYESYNKEAHEN